MVAIVKSNRVLVLQIDVVMRLGRCSDDESDSYAWVGYHISPIRRVGCLGLASRVSLCGVPL